MNLAKSRQRVWYQLWTNTWLIKCALIEQIHAKVHTNRPGFEANVDICNRFSWLFDFICQYKVIWLTLEISKIYFEQSFFVSILIYHTVGLESNKDALAWRWANYTGKASLISYLTTSTFRQIIQRDLYYVKEGISFIKNNNLWKIKYFLKNHNFHSISLRYAKKYNFY